MLRLARPRWRLKASFKSEKQLLIQEIKNHVAWKDDIPLCEVASLLAGNVPFTYCLSQGMDECHFFLSFVDSDQVVRHKNVRVLLDQRSWRVKNGAEYSYESVSPLIPNCLNCSKDVCVPLA